MKRVLIISPYSPPTNAADMQRVRMSLPYFTSFGWDAEVVTVDPAHSFMVKDHLLEQSVPAGTRIHRVSALSQRLTSKLGLGSIAIRALPYYWKEVNRLLRKNKYDLVYFSTTQFPVCVLGPFWKRKYGVPYVIDMQDPWHSEYYRDKPGAERPPKYWFSYYLNKYTEPVAMRYCDGLISVSKAYVEDLQHRYPALAQKPASVITFGAFEPDFRIVKDNDAGINKAFIKDSSVYNLVYIGRGGADMSRAVTLLFASFKRGLQEAPELFAGFRFHFIGTSYAPNGEGKKTIFPLAEEAGIGEYVTEQTDRIPFYSGLASLQEADGLVVPGSDDPGYTASKLYPYIMSRKPFLGIFHPASSAFRIVSECQAGEMISINDPGEKAYQALASFIADVRRKKEPKTDWSQFRNYTAQEMCRRQVLLFEQVLASANTPKTGSVQVKDAGPF